MTPAAWLLALPVRGYRLVFSPWVGHNCRYLPSCSAYALEALAAHGALRGVMAAGRVCRCHPFGGFGLDPCPGEARVRGTAQPLGACAPLRRNARRDRAGILRGDVPRQ